MVSNIINDTIDQDMIKLSSSIAMNNYLNIEDINTARQINAVVVNISGRQRMLSQRIALFALRLVCTKNPQEREKIRITLLENINLMSKSHEGLIHGNFQMKLSGNLSETIREMYFDWPLNLDQKLKSYLNKARKLALSPLAELTLENADLQYIQNQASTELIEALDAIVMQYQTESDAEQLILDLYQVELYKQSCAATKNAQDHAHKLAETLEELKATQMQLIQREKMSTLGNLLAGVAHEINNPVSFVNGNLKYAQEYVESIVKVINLYQEEYPNPVDNISNLIEDCELDYILEDLPKILTSLKMGSDRICEIVSSLKNFTHSEQSSPQKYDIHQGIDSTLLILNNKIKDIRKNREITVIKDYDNLPLIECYPGKINQVLMNLISNAIDALESKEIDKKSQIKITTECIDNQQIKIKIADNGCGITEEAKSKLFEPFFTTKPVGKGTGLGLSISYQIIVENHRGKLDCISEEGKGTEFIIELPIKF